MDRFDVLVIGAGQAGPTLAMSLAKAGRRVAIAERKDVGGSCINFGCTPTKAAIASARVAHLARRGSDFGLRIPAVEVNYEAVIGRARRIVDQSRSGLESKLRNTDNLTLFPAHARFEGRDGDRFRLWAGEALISAKHVVLDTGTRSVIPPIEGLDRAGCIHAGNWLEVADLPEKLAIVGGGYIGLEMAQLYQRLGSQVVVLESGAQIAGHEDADVASFLQDVLESEGIEFRLKTRLQKVEGRPGALKLEISGPTGTSILERTHVFVATGRQPNTDDLGLETIGVRMSDQGIVEVDTRLSSSVKGVWVAGDIRGGPMFTHTAWDDNRVIESQIAGDGSRTTDRIVPYAVFTDPELGRVGMTEQDARQAGYSVEVGRMDMAQNGKARELGETAGFIKVVVDSATDRLLGAAVLANEGAELVHIYIALVNARAPFQAIQDSVFIHPTLAEAAQSAVATLQQSSGKRRQRAA